MKTRTLFATTSLLSLVTLTELNAVVTTTRQPTNQWVSLGAHVTNQVTVTSTAPPITYQWHGPSGQLLTGETNRISVTLSLVIPSIQLNQAGGYYVVVNDGDNQPAQSNPATLTVDPTFIKITAGPLVTTVDPSHNATWWDYDGDGYLDVIVQEVSGPGRVQAFYRNQGDGTFTQITTNAIALSRRNGLGGAVGDCDNDGWLDILAADCSFEVGAASLPNVLFHNRGDGTFEQVDVGSPIRDGDVRYDVRFVDYDNDGFLDLLMICGSDYPRLNHLYRNNGPAIDNTNHWLKIKLNGQASNRSGIGAKIRVKATLGGKEIWQVREMTGNGYSQTCPGLIAHFGLGDSIQATTVRIEWPSGIVQELTNVAAGELTTVTEHQAGPPPPPAFAGASFAPTGFDLAIAEPVAGVVYVLEGSADLVTWTKLMARTSAGGIHEWVDEQGLNQPTRFYRQVVPWAAAQSGREVGLPRRGAGR